MMSDMEWKMDGILSSNVDFVTMVTAAREGVHYLCVSVKFLMMLSATQILIDNLLLGDLDVHY